MATSTVERATSDMLIAPDWSMNIEICDILNGDPGQAKEIIKALKKRISHKNPKIQILALTLLEALMQNCGENVHQQVAERDVLHDMVKLVKKKADLNVKEKILVLLEAWQEAFGGPTGKYPQYYSAYNELVRAGVQFPPRPETFAPLFTPPQTHPITNYSPETFDPALYEGGIPASVIPEDVDFSSADIENARGSMNLLAEMLNALDPREGMKQDVLTDLVERCRTSKKQVLHLVNTTQDEELLGKGLALNDDLESVLAKYDAIVAGHTVTWPKTSSALHPSNATPAPNASAPDYPDEEEADADLVQLSRRFSKTAGKSQENLSGNKPSLPLIPPPPGLKRVNVPVSQSQQRDFLSGEVYESPIRTPPVLVGSSDMTVGSKMNAYDKDVPESRYSSSPLSQQSGRQNGNDSFSTSATKPNEYNQIFQKGMGSFPDNSVQSVQDSDLAHKSPRSLPPAPWEVEASQSREVQDSDETFYSFENNVKSMIPPPPSKYSQRQQFFQQQHASVPGQHTPDYSDKDHDNLSRMTGKLSLQDDGYNSYGKGYPQQSSASKPQVKPEDKLFGDLVDFAKVKHNLNNKTGGL